MITVYMLKDLGYRIARRLRNAIRLISGMEPSISPESNVSDEERSQPDGVSETERPPTMKQRLSSNRRSNHGRH
jgi:hypothetical protein